MFRVILVFLFLVILWGALWLTVAVFLLMPLFGEQITSAVGTLAGLAVGAWLMQWSMDYGYRKGWIKW